MTQLESKKPASLPPGDKGLPLIGESLSFLFDPDFGKKKLKKYGHVYKTNIFGNNAVIMIGAEANQFLFRNENQYVVSTWPKSTRILLGKLSLSTNPEFLTKSAIAKHRSLTGSGFEQSDRRFPQPTVCCQILS